MQGNAARARNVSEQIYDYERRQAEIDLAGEVQLDDLAMVPWWSLEGKDPPARNWMVENCFLKGTVGLVAGDGGVGKSLILQQLATCAALGLPWLGFKLTRGNALMLACEDDADELWRRQWSINRHLGIRMLDLVDQQLDTVNGVPRLRLTIWPRTGQDNTLLYLDKAQWRMATTELFERIVRRCKRDGIRYLIIDTVTQTFRGNQNDETQVMDYVSEFRRLAIAIEGVVILTKHPSMAGRALGTGESGNVAWSNGSRSRFYLHKDKASGRLLWSVKKSNYGPADVEVALRWKDGVFILHEPEQGYDERYYQR